MDSRCNQVCFTNYPIWNHWSIPLYYGKIFLSFQCLTVTWDVSTHPEKPLMKPRCTLYKAHIFFQAFLGGGEEEKSSLDNTVHLLLKDHTLQIATGFWTLTKSEPTPKTKRDETAPSNSGETNDTAGKRSVQVLIAPAFKFSLPPASCVALRHHHGFQLLCEMGKHRALSKVIMSRW